MEPDQHCELDDFTRRLIAAGNRWRIAQRIIYVVLLCASFLMLYLLWWLDEALDKLTP